MPKKRSSITLTVFAGYLLLVLIGGLAVWYAYSRVISYANLTANQDAGNEKLLLVGEAATKLYEAESLSRQLIQASDLAGLEDYSRKIDSIKLTLASLQNFRVKSSVDQEIDSINLLLSQKTQNLRQLLELRASGETESYYTRVLNELRKVDETFEDPNYDQRFRDLEPHQRSLLVKLLEYARIENSEPSNLTVDSLVTAVKSVLTQLQVQERTYRERLRNQEDELLENEIQLNNRLRTLFSAIENEERRNSIEQVESWQNKLEETSENIALLGAISLVVIMIFLFLVIRDVSQSQKYRRELEKAKNYAESLLRSREQFMNTVTHDLRSPLNSVVGFTGLLQKSGMNSSQRRYLEHIKKSSDYILHLVNDLLDFSKLEAGKMTVDALPFNPKNLIEETAANAIPPEKPEAVEIRLEIAEDLNQLFITDPFRLKQVLTNLISNACKFTEEGHVLVKATLEKRDEQRILLIDIEDTGIGISKEQRDKVFEEFSQENSSIERRFGGFGLGLAISKKITDLLGGQIHLQSEEGKGSVFSIQIPLGIYQKESAKKTEVPLHFEKAKKVLIVDDEPAQIGLLKELLKSAGLQVQEAANGRQALEVIQKERPDVILTDIQMPELNGLQLLKRLKNDSDTADIPVIALSGQPDVSSEDYRNLGFFSSLLKPYSSSSLLEILEEALKLKFKKRQDQFEGDNLKANGYSLKEIRNFSGDDQQALRSILTAFIESTSNNLEVLDYSYQKKDWEKISQIAHKMLPMIRQLKASVIINQLELLERGKEEVQKTVEIKILKEQIQKLMESLKKEIRD